VSTSVRDIISTRRQEPGDSAICRILLLRNHGTELLLAKREEGGLGLPSVAIRPGNRITEEVNDAVEAECGIAAYCLFRPRVFDMATKSPNTFYQVMEIAGAAAPKLRDTVWLSLSSLREEAFVEKSDGAALEAAKRNIDEYRNRASLAPFGCPGWLEELLAWVAKEASALGLRLTGNIRQFNSGPQFCLLRIETAGSALWFKATGDPNRQEYPISTALAHLFPGYVPQVIATREEWNGWLSLEAQGELLESRSDPHSWETAAQRLAELQIRSLGELQPLIRVGCKDVRIDSLRKQLGQFFDVVNELMNRQKRISPAPMSSDQLTALRFQLGDAIDRLDAFTIPDALNHLDFNPGNILGDADGCVFLDWAEAAIGVPFFTFEYLRCHFLQSNCCTTDGEMRLIGAYRKSWERFIPHEDVHEAMTLARCLAVFASVVSSGIWRNVLDDDEVSAGYLRSLARRMQKEASLLDFKTTR
jgi:hypothetical protein